MGDSGLWGKRTMGRCCKYPVPYSYDSYSQAALTCEAEATQGRDGSVRGVCLQDHESSLPEVVSNWEGEARPGSV